MIKNKEKTVRVEVSPASIKKVLGQANDFLAGAGGDHLSLFLVGNWKFSLVGGAVASVFFLLYAGGVL